jgi:hypothetical protein
MTWILIFGLGVVLVARRLHQQTERFTLTFWVAQLPWFKRGGGL